MRNDGVELAGGNTNRVVRARVHRSLEFLQRRVPKTTERNEGGAREEDKGGGWGFTLINWLPFVYLLRRMPPSCALLRSVATYASSRSNSAPRRDLPTPHAACRALHHTVRTHDRSESGRARQAAASQGQCSSLSSLAGQRPRQRSSSSSLR